MIDFDRKLIFIHVPKTAGSAIESALMDDPRLLDHDDPQRTARFLNEHADNFCGLHHPHASLRRHQRQLGDSFKEYKVFTVVRNPWAASFSRFCYLFQHKGESFMCRENFCKFLSFYSESRYRKLIGPDGDPLVHYILNFSDVENEMNRMLRELNLPETRLPRGNTSLSASLDYRQFYSEKARKIVEKRFWYEILRFGWKFETSRAETRCYHELPRWKRERLKMACVYRRARRGIANRRRVILRELSSPARSRKIERKDSITATACSHPPALPGLQSAVESLIEQVDRVCVYLNDVQTVPSWLQHPNIRVVLSRDAAGDLKANGSHYFSEGLSGYCFTFDDDIAYPPDYVSTMIRKIEAYKRRAIVCVHGGVLRYPITSYYLSRHSLTFNKRLREDVRVDIGSSGTLAYHTDTIRFCLDDFPAMNLNDVYLSLKAARNNVPIVSIEREKGWLQKTAPDDRPYTIYSNWSKYDDAATALIKENGNLFDHHNLFLPPS